MTALVPRLLVVGLLLAVASDVSGQVLNGEIFGRVSDQTDAVLPGATITVAGPALIQPMTVVSAGSGAFQFPRVPIGTYNVRVDLPGFGSVLREGIIVQAGRSVELNIKLALSTVQETVTITGASPVVDTKSTALGVNFGRELLEAIPTARDPWVIIEQTPGLVMSANNVGGRNSGQMEGYNAYGSGSNKQWSMDGATVTDMASNSAPTYYDFDMFEEIQIMTGGMDASQESGGVSVNMVTKSGGNQVRGSGRLFVVDKALQSKNAPPEVVAQGGGAGNPLKNNHEYGVEVGGPIKRDRAWYLGIGEQPESQHRNSWLLAGRRTGRLDRYQRPQRRHHGNQQPECEAAISVERLAQIHVPLSAQRQGAQCPRREFDHRTRVDISPDRADRILQLQPPVGGQRPADADRPGAVQRRRFPAQLPHGRSRHRAGAQP